TAAVKSDMAVIGDEAAEPTAPVAAEPPQSTPTTSSRPPAPTFSYDKTPGGGVVGQRDDDVSASPAPAAPPTDAAINAAAIPTGKRFFTPVVLRMAEEHGIDLSTVEGSGA